MDATEELARCTEYVVRGILLRGKANFLSKLQRIVRIFELDPVHIQIFTRNEELEYMFTLLEFHGTEFRFLVNVKLFFVGL